jgi:hypothetical protein
MAGSRDMTAGRSKEIHETGTFPPKSTGFLLETTGTSNCCSETGSFRSGHAQAAVLLIKLRHLQN